MAVAKAPKIVPWTSTEEYMNVADWLYSTELRERKRGVAVVKAWRARGRVPAAIEATANLAEILIADQERRQGMSISQLRHMYSMALIRFVNSIVDLEQRGTFAQSMTTLATRIGMPAWFVELRHTCTHEQIPSLMVLRSACEQAHSWIGDYYWKRQARTLPEDTMAHIREAISAYVTLRAKAKGDGSNASTPVKKGTADARAFETAKKSLKLLLGQLHEDAVRLYVVPVLVEPGFLVPDDKRLRSRFPDCAMPARLIQQWSSILRLFTEAWGESLFFEELLSGIVATLLPDPNELSIFESSERSPSTSHAATLVAWIGWIIQNYYVPDNTTASPAISLDDLLEGCLRSPCYYSRAVLRIVSAHDPTLKRELRPFVDFMGKALTALVAVESETKAGSAKKGIRFSEESLRQEEELMAQRLKQTFEAETEMTDVQAMHMDSTIDPSEARTQAAPAAASRWSCLAQPAWSPCPIGTLGDGSIPSLEWPSWLDDVPLHLTS
ncbi:rRNA-processing protein las1 [Coemansia guatemalensis]|uniref:rRNA-processing protein las1 n=1 Tax=Coemansia guatemalensis TaxID=2761395 RepID=A0A9W8I230_9FUNG|nr:rRNA-processing protein las1 [Coemansia guatemalensis]